MDQNELTNRLVELMGALEPGPGTSPSDFEDGRAEVARALMGGEPVEAIRAGAGPALSAITPLHEGDLKQLTPERLSQIGETASAAIKRAAAQPPEMSAPLVYLRTSPLRGDLSPSTPDWARGMTVARSFGPFTGPGGISVWIESLLVIKETSFVRDPSSTVFAVFPVDTANPANTKRHLVLGPGSVWIAARELAPASPSGTWTGFKIKGGTLDFSADLKLIAGVVHVPATAIGTLNADLVEAATSPPTAGPGVDASHAVLSFPASVSIKFTHGGAQVVALGDFSATVYGMAVTLKRNSKPPAYNPPLREIIIPADAAPAQFSVVNSLSTMFFPSGTAPITRAGWSLPVAVTTPPQLGQASGPGAIVLDLGSGMQAEWTDLVAPEPFQTVTLHLVPGQIGLITTLSAPLSQDLELWDESPVSGPPRRSSVAVTAKPGAELVYISQYLNLTGVEGLLVPTAAASAHLDRPVRADGTRFAIQCPSAVFIIIQTITDLEVTLSGAVQPSDSQKPIPLALENAFMTVQSPTHLLIKGRFQSDGTVASGNMVLNFLMLSGFPILPDPYAANFPFRESAILLGADRGLTATVTWPSPSQPRLTFTLAPPSTSPLGSSSSPAAGPQATDTPSVGLAGTGRLGTFATTRGQYLALVDVSGNADQLGVVVASNPDRALTISIDSVALACDGSALAIFTVPEVSWEPMASDSAIPPAKSGYNFPVPYPPSDGGPTFVQVPVLQKLGRIEPTPLLHQYVSAAGLKGAQVNALFSLPFGLRAYISVQELLPRGGVFRLNQPGFPTAFRGGLQLTLKPPSSGGDAAMFPGPQQNSPFNDGSFTSLIPAFAPIPPNPLKDEGYGVDVLGYDVASIFDGEFNQSGFKRGVPVRRIDLSGYGASMFSDWRDLTASGVQVIKVQFDTLVGRTGYEVIQVQSYKFPWSVRVVRTITIQRQGAGWILRRDSGWQPATDGTFQYPISTDFPNSVYTGAVPGVFHIRNIQENGPPLTISNPAGDPDGAGSVTYQPVLFDADVQIHSDLDVVLGGVSGGASTTYVPSQGMVGYIQIDKMVGPQHSPNPANRLEIAALLRETGPLGGPVSCTVAIGQKGSPATQMKGTSVDVSVTGPATDPTPALVATLRGTLQLPRDGDWSLGKISGNQTAPVALDPQFAAPLVRNTAQDPNTWHIADPSDILNLTSPSTQYGLLQSTGTQKIFFAQPQIPQVPPIAGNNIVNIPNAPNLADVGALLNATGIFPDLQGALNFPSGQQLGVGSDGLGLKKQQFPINSPPKTLVDFGGVVKVVMNYQSEDTPPKPTVATITIDPTANPRWSVSLARVGFAVFFTPIDSQNPLLSLYGAIQADANSAPTLTNLNVVYGGVMQPVENIFHSLSEAAAFLPGGGGANLNVSFSQGKLTIFDSFAVPSIPLGVGEINDVAFDLGFTLQLSPQSLTFTAGLGSEQKPFHWLVSPLSGTGVIQVGAQDSKPTVLIQGGIGVGLEIDIGIAKGAASIVLAMQVDNTKSPFEIKAILTGQASVDVLDGLASATLTLSAGLGIVPVNIALPSPSWPPQLGIPPETVTFIASVGVGIHISICWVLDVDFDGYWQFSQTITTPGVSI